MVIKGARSVLDDAPPARNLQAGGLPVAAGILGTVLLCRAGRCFLWVRKNYAAGFCPLRGSAARTLGNTPTPGLHSQTLSLRRWLQGEDPGFPFLQWMAPRCICAACLLFATMFQPWYTRGRKKPEPVVFVFGSPPFLCTRDILPYG